MNFDEEVDRYNTNCLKYDFKSYYNVPDDVYPMWIADMDFRCCDEILNALHKKIDHGVFGYSKYDNTYFKAIQNWYKNNFDTDLKEEWLVQTPGVVFALATAVKALTNIDDHVLITNPVYHPFTEIIKNNNRKIVSSNLVLKNDHYEINFEDFENKIKQYNVKLFLLCSPHNPVGRVWTKNELNTIIEICKKYDVFIVCDEIHSDFVWNNNHTCLLKYKDYHERIMLCTSPSKTFNLAGLQVSNIFIPNSKMRKRLQLELRNLSYSSVNILGLIACQSAYENGQAWLDELKAYLLGNINYVDNFLKENLPKIKLIYPEGTYLLWLDFNELNLSDENLDKLLINEAKLWLSGGKCFGTAGKGFQRLNIALPRKKLEYAMKQLENTFKKY